LAFVMQCKVSNSPFVLNLLRIPSLYFCQEPAIKMLEPHYRGRLQDGRLAVMKRQFMNWVVAIDRVNALHATLICANSLYSRENIYRAYGIYPRLNYLGVDAQYFHPLNLQREPMVLCVGALNPAKGQDIVIESVGCSDTRPRIKFIYNFSYGSEVYREQLTQRAKTLGILVSFEALPAEKDLVTAYNQASLTLFPSLLEPLGLVPLESMACGTPVVGVAEAGIRETVQHNETGFLTERNPRELGQAIDKLLNEKPLWTRMSELGRQRVLESWTWERSYEKLEKHLQMTLDQ